MHTEDYSDPSCESSTTWHKNAGRLNGRSSTASLKGTHCDSLSDRLASWVDSRLRVGWSWGVFVVVGEIRGGVEIVARLIVEVQVLADEARCADFGSLPSACTGLRRLPSQTRCGSLLLPCLGHRALRQS
jgi:hypothetical protein